MEIILAAVVGYLLGSVPISLLLGKLRSDADVRDFGSGKTGFTNSLRVFGLKRSVPVLIGDLAKGAGAASLPLLWSDDPWARAAGGLSAVIGHVWPLFAGFRGGRGVLTGAGALLALSPLAVAVVAPPALAVLYLTRYVSLTSIVACAVAGLSFAVAAALDLLPAAYAVAAVSGATLIIGMHHDNIGRLLTGTERKLGQGGERRIAAEAEP